MTVSADEIRAKRAAGEGSLTDRTHVNALTDEDIERAMRADPDWADQIDVNWDDAVTIYPAPKKAVSIRLDQDIVDFFQATGKGYQTRVNAVLRHYMTQVKRNKSK